MNKWNEYRGLWKLIALVVAVPLAAWILGFRQTISMWQTFQTQQKRTAQIQTDKCQPQVNDIIKVTRPVLLNGLLLNQLTPILQTDNVSVVKYTPCLTREGDTFQIATGELIVSGRFIPLLTVMHKIENDIKFGKIISSSFRIHEDKNKREKQLHMTLIIQQLTLTTQTIKKNEP